MTVLKFTIDINTFFIFAKTFHTKFQNVSDDAFSTDVCTVIRKSFVMETLSFLDDRRETRGGTGNRLLRIFLLKTTGCDIFDSWTQIREQCDFISHDGLLLFLIVSYRHSRAESCIGLY